MEQLVWNQQFLTIPVNNEVLHQCSHWVTRHDFQIIGLDSATSSPSYSKSRLTIRIISLRQVSYCTLSITNSSYRPTDKPTINRHSGFQLQASLHHLSTFRTVYFDKNILLTIDSRVSMLPLINVLLSLTSHCIQSLNLTLRLASLLRRNEGNHKAPRPKSRGEKASRKGGKHRRRARVTQTSQRKQIKIYAVGEEDERVTYWRCSRW